MIDSAAHLLDPRRVDTVIGSIFLLASLAVILWVVWKTAGAWMRSAVFELRGQKTPAAKQKEALEQMRRSLITEEEAIARVREYAAANGWEFEKPRGITLTLAKTGPEKKGSRPAGKYVYRVILQYSRPMHMVEVDASDGTILAPRIGLR